MAKRTLFYPQPLLGQDTGDAQSLRSYIERLALSHNMKPRGLLDTLLKEHPLEDLSADLHQLQKRWAVHGFAEVGAQLQSRLEAATGSSLAGATLMRYKGLFASVNLTRANDPVYCPCCVTESEGAELPYGRLLWEVQCVEACPVHRVKLRSAKLCGAQPEERLPANQRPSLSGVCIQCGSVGFKCLAKEPLPATGDEIWVASQVRRLLDLPIERVARCSAESLRTGLTELVKCVYGGSVVRASQQAGLSRASVYTWVAGEILAGLPGLLQICFHAKADVCALIDGVYRSLDSSPAEKSPPRRLQVVERTYNRSELNDDQIRELLEAAATEAEPPSLMQFARRHGLNVDVPRQRFVREAAVLAAANAQHMQLVYERRYVEAVHAYTAAVQALLRQGLSVHAKSIQKQSGVVAFSQNHPRVRALQEVLSKHRLETGEEKGGRLKAA